MLRTPNRAAVAGFSSTLSLPTRTRPARSAASSSMTAAMILLGPHHVAHMSSSTGSGERSTSAAKVASVTVTGLPSTARGALQRPHTGSRPCASFSVGTRFIAPQDLIVRTSVPPSTLMPAVRGIIRKADPQLPITNMRTLEEVVSLETAPRVVQLRVLGGFAVIALGLAAIGIHGLLAFSVSSRVREIGVRIALGARAMDIMWMVMGRSTTLALVGVTLGSVLAYAAGRSLQALLFGVSPASATVFAGAIGVSLLMTLAGSILPAWRAIRVDPMAATRVD